MKIGKYKIMRCLNSFGTTNAKKHSKPLGYEPTQVSDDFYVVIEQIRKKQNELSYKNMYFGKGKIDKKILGEITKLPASS